MDAFLAELDFWIASCRVGFAQNELEFGITNLELLSLQMDPFSFFESGT